MKPKDIKIIDGCHVTRYVASTNRDEQDFLVCPCEEWYERNMKGEIRPSCKHTRKWHDRNLFGTNHHLIAVARTHLHGDG